MTDYELMKQAVFDCLNGYICADDHLELTEKVENLFAPGAECDVLYGQMVEARESLRERLKVTGEDRDLETIVDCMNDIARIISMRMYDFGTANSELEVYLPEVKPFYNGERILE